MTEIKPEEIEALIETFESSTWEELRLRIGDFELFLSKTSDARGLPSHPSAQAPPGADPAHPPAPPRPAAPLDETDFPPHWIVVRAPNLGTFYRAPKPGAPAYVTVGQRVETNAEVCLIEVMKLFTTVLAGAAGVVRKVLAEDAELVEYDQPLILIEPD